MASKVTDLLFLLCYIDVQDMCTRTINTTFFHVQFYMERHLHGTELFSNDRYKFGLHFMGCRVLKRSHD
jgi:hypothetical protein